MTHRFVRTEPVGEKILLGADAGRAEKLIGGCDCNHRAHLTAEVACERFGALPSVADGGRTGFVHVGFTIGQRQRHLGVVERIPGGALATAAAR